MVPGHIVLAAGPRGRNLNENIIVVLGPNVFCTVSLMVVDTR